jgi:hypothetical protein
MSSSYSHLRILTHIKLRGVHFFSDHLLTSAQNRVFRVNFQTHDRSPFLMRLSWYYLLRCDYPRCLLSENQQDLASFYHHASIVYLKLDFPKKKHSTKFTLKITRCGILMFRRYLACKTLGRRYTIMAHLCSGELQCLPLNGFWRL